MTTDTINPTKYLARKEADETTTGRLYVSQGGHHVNMDVDLLAMGLACDHTLVSKRSDAEDLLANVLGLFSLADCQRKAITSAILGVAGHFLVTHTGAARNADGSWTPATDTPSGYTFKSVTLSMTSFQTGRLDSIILTIRHGLATSKYSTDTRMLTISRRGSIQLANAGRFDKRKGRVVASKARVTGHKALYSLTY